MQEQPQFLDVSGTRIAVRHQAGGAPGLVWLGGFMSDMLGSKAETLAALASQSGLSYTRHDYSGHGESGGAFRDGTISRWLAQSIAVFERYTEGPQILVGSSMGAWIALRMVQEINRGAADDRIAGLILLAPAPDFTSDLHAPKLTEDQISSLATHGYFEAPSGYSDEPYVFTRELFEDGDKNRVLTGPIDTHCPVHILQGMEDPDVPYQHAEKLAALLSKDDVTLTFIKDGDHRLSRPEDLSLLERTVTGMVETIRQG
ncbi:alpha/beta hydrolase [Oricola sp.]|uniref:alpha/beta hydrolase n=1 Tax=Oricola sp. TaxID=1979950 RepID=UPI003BAACA64